jgi:leukotriene-A4 hydrolase
MSIKDLIVKSPAFTSRDSHSFSEPDLVRVKHLDLELQVLFERRILKGVAVLTLDDRFSGRLMLDTRDLTIARVEYSHDFREFHQAFFELGDPTGLGAPLIIHLPTRALWVRIHYATSENASGLQWLEPSQTTGKIQPFLFTQSAATHARSWIPLQDTPQVRMTWSARVHKPGNLRALMSATNNPEAYLQPQPQFRMSYPVPAYLIALAVGDLEFRELGSRTGVFAEQGVINAAARELEDLEQTLRATEELFGPYRWGRYDVLVLPPSFPVGGMENACLTFVTPTFIAGDKSLTSLIVHEMAHSWSSNLVSNATWEQFWINEGFTVYMERRILEKLYGPQRAEMEAVLGLRDLREELVRVDPKDQILDAPANGRDPNAQTDVPYEKGALFLRTIETVVGRARFDAFLRRYFDHFAFQSVTTDQFIEFLYENLLNQCPEAVSKLQIEEWVHGIGLPAGTALPKSDAMEIVEGHANRWLQGEVAAHELQTSSWSTQEWLHFLKYIFDRVDASKMSELDSTFHLTNSGNSEITSQWLLMAIRNHYQPAYKRLEQFLTSVGRRKYLKSLYGELAKTPDGKAWAQSIYERARLNYHPIGRQAVKSVLD